MAEDQVELIRSKIDIVNLVSSYLPLKKSGKNYKANCPFHSEKTPSFMVSPELQIFKCFGCSLGGDAYRFVMEMEGIEFREALELLADRAGVKLDRARPSGETSRRQRLLAINHLAGEFFSYLLEKHRYGEKARDYLKSRGIQKESWSRFGLGYAPQSWDSLGNYLQKKDYLITDIVASGLALAKPSGRGYYDRFRGRVTFALKDERGRILGFSARTLAGEDPKYLNSPETPVFKKDRILYGLDLAKGAIKTTQEAVVVEGEFDVISSYQAGIKNVVAAKGTALTEGQLVLLQRYTDSLVLFFDTDLAGDAASRRGIELAARLGFNLRVGVLPEKYQDADEALRDDPKIFTQAVKKALGVYDFYFASAARRFDLSAPLGKKRAAAFLVPKLAVIPNEIEKDHYIRKLAEFLEVAETAVRKELGKVKGEAAAMIGVDRAEEAAVAASLILEEYLLALVLKSPLASAQSTLHKLAQKDFNDPLVRELFTALKTYLSGRKRPFKVDYFSKRLEEKLSGLLGKLYLYDLTVLSEDETAWERELTRAVSKLKEAAARAELRDLSRQIKRAEAAGQRQELTKLQKEFNEVAKRIR